MPLEVIPVVRNDKVVQNWRDQKIAKMIEIIRKYRAKVKWDPRDLAEELVDYA